MNAVDTNILIYVRDLRDAEKQRIASQLIASLEEPVLLWQVACEYVAASRKLTGEGHSLQQAFQDIRELGQLWPVHLPSLPVIDRAERLLSKYSLSYWDAMLLTACQVGSVRRLYSEDFDSYAQVDDVELVNPFRG